MSATPAGDPPRRHLAWILQILLAVAYPFLAHGASATGSGTLAALSILDIVLLVLVEPLLRGRIAAWLACLACGAGLWWLASSPYAHLPLLLVPVAFIALVAWAFARTLRTGSVPLITRIVAALESKPAAALDDDLLRYTRRLTLAWALMLLLLALCNLLLAAIAVPNGLLATFGVVPAVSVTETQWSWFANWLNYGIVGGFFMLEYLYRKRRFPGRYRNFADFVGRMARLGPAFWRGFLR